MKAITKILAGGAFVAAVAIAAPASAQYYPGYGNGYGYGGGGNVIGQVLNSVLGGGTYGYNSYGTGYGANSQVAVNQCASAVQQRLGGGYGGSYGGGGRVLGISRVEPRGNGGLTIRGVASSGRYAGAYGYGQQAPVDLTWKCKVDFRGYVSDISLDRVGGSYGYNQGYGQGYSQGYTPYDYSQYGYRRY